MYVINCKRKRLTVLIGLAPRVPTSLKLMRIPCTPLEALSCSFRSTHRWLSPRRANRWWRSRWTGWQHNSQAFLIFPPRCLCTPVGGRCRLRPCYIVIRFPAGWCCYWPVPQDSDGAVGATITTADHVLIIVEPVSCERPWSAFSIIKHNVVVALRIAESIQGSL